MLPTKEKIKNPNKKSIETASKILAEIFISQVEFNKNKNKKNENTNGQKNN